MSIKSIKSNLAKQQISIKEVVAYGTGMFSIGIGGMGTAVYLTFFWTDIVMLPLAAVTMIMLFSRVFDACNDVISAWLIDRTKSKYGKARAWILYSTIPAAIASTALFYTPNFNLAGKIIWAAIMYNLVNTLYSDFCLIPVTSLISLMTPDSQGRVTLSVSGQLGQVLSAIVGSITFVAGVAFFGGGTNGYFGYFTMTFIVMTAGLFFTFAASKEKVKPIENNEKIRLLTAIKIIITNKWWFMAIGSQCFLFMMMTFMSVTIYYMQYIVKDLVVLTLFATVMNIGQFIIPFFMPPLIKKFDSIKATIIMLLISLVGFLLPLFNLTSIVILVISSLLRGIGMSAMASTRFAILGDVVDYSEWKTGKRVDALIFSGSSFSAKIGMALASAIVTIVLGATGYVGGAATQVASANTAIIILFTVVNGIFVIGTILCLYGLNGMTASMKQVRTELNEKRNLSLNIE